ncbi:hypothetical protein [Mycolicibacterium hodleri]|uniref:hypothetical protein n=1 Tax=Mycolicibacterium hodleri TaxID=49897 RepID=UPI001F36E2C8|nr:hypothetical protein [Mycolicibacterium hodleri]
MTAAGTSKLEARRRAVEAARRANEARAARDKANIEDAATYLVAVGRIAEVETWKKERLARLREQVDAEAGKRVAVHRAEAGAAIVRMQDRGETLATISSRTEAGVGEVRAMLRHAPKPENFTASNGSHALGVGEKGIGCSEGGDSTANEPPAAAATAYARTAVTRGPAMTTQGMGRPG